MGRDYLVHYNGWNTRYDEWINEARIAEKVTGPSKATRPQYAKVRVACYTLIIYRIAGKFGGLAVYVTTAKLKSAKISYSHNYICMAIPYRTTKFKFANILILGSTAEFNSRQYFRLYSRYT